MITHQQALNRLIDGNELFFDEMLDIMRQIMRGDMTPAQIAGILIGLRVKVESVSEIAAAATVMREFATTVPVAERRHLVDTCGTGGDGAHTFNISTTAAFIVAAAGARLPSTEAAPFRPARAVQTYWKPWESSWPCRLKTSAAASMKSALASCLHPTTIRP